jgi:hypothetical protein
VIGRVRKGDGVFLKRAAGWQHLRTGGWLHGGV